MQDEKTIRRLEDLSTLLDKRYMRIDMAKNIYSLMCRYRQPPTRVVEVGTYCGTGTILLAAMVKPWGGHVTTIDLPWTGSANQYFEKTADDWIKETGTDNVTVVRRDDGAEGWFKDFYARNEKPLDLVYLDGGHLWINNLAQFAAAYASLRVGGWIIMDDINYDVWADVRHCWKNIVCRIVPQVHRHEIGQLGFAMR